MVNKIKKQKQTKKNDLIKFKNYHYVLKSWKNLNSYKYQKKKKKNKNRD